MSRAGESITDLQLSGLLLQLLLLLLLVTLDAIETVTRILLGTDPLLVWLEERGKKIKKEKLAVQLDKGTFRQRERERIKPSCLPIDHL